MSEFGCRFHRFCSGPHLDLQSSLVGDVFLKLVVDVFLGSEYKKNIFRGITDSRGQERLSQMRLDKLKSTRSGSG